MPLTKSDIDVLVDGMPSVPDEPLDTLVVARQWRAGGNAVARITRANVRRMLYLSAGLTAEGERKPERVRCWMWVHADGKPFHMAFSDPIGLVHIEADELLIPGWFVPDGAE